MEFVVATIEFWLDHFVPTSHLAKSWDNKLALMHIEFAEIMVPGVREMPEVRIFEYNTEELNSFLVSEEWIGVQTIEGE